MAVDRIVSFLPSATELLYEFEDGIAKLKKNEAWTKAEIFELFLKMIPDFGHKETGKYLDSKM